MGHLAMKIYRFIYCFLLLFSVISVSNGILVPDGDCPVENPKLIYPKDCPPSEIKNCRRTDGPVTITDHGSPNNLSKGSLECDNTASADPNCPCEDTPPPPLYCVENINVSHTETVDVKVSASVSLGTPVIQAALETSIGHANARTFSTAVLCGSTAIPPCEKMNYEATLVVQQNISSQMWHSFTWDYYDCDDKYTGTVYGGTAVSTASGDSYNASSAKCNSVTP